MKLPGPNFAITCFYIIKNVVFGNCNESLIFVLRRLPPKAGKCSTKWTDARQATDKTVKKLFRLPVLVLRDKFVNYKVVAFFRDKVDKIQKKAQI